MKKMAADRRYELIEKIGSGDFATTFSAKDLRLNRQVAIKRLHDQYLQDDHKLERYWDEAQLLASLEHPNNMTIYDVVRARGCLVLELMQGSLRQIYGRKPMPVEDVRQTLIQALKGLQCLHDNGIVHGDVNPNNLFLSRQDVVKLGDFGLARRVDDDDGSLIKGTTRYIAPEIVSEEFGQVGPASDLYSLGFSALELLVGPDFESLFPDLIAFGRDRKMAWMMWHCSADRKFPPLQSILDGVPDDLAKVLEKLTTKDQSKRYKTAQEALDELSANPVPVGQSLKDEARAAAELAKKQKQKRLRRALVICCFSLLISVGIFYFTREAPEPVARQVPPPIRGVVQNVLSLDQKLVLDQGTDWKEITLRDGDKVVLNRLERQLRDLEIGDRVTVHTRLDPDDRSHYELVAFRPETHVGVLESVDGDASKFVLRVTEGIETDKQFDIFVPEGTPITLNTLARSRDDSPLTVAALATGDSVTVQNCDDEEGMLALSIEAYRDTELKGMIREIERNSRIITLSLTEENSDADAFVRMPLYPDCVFTLNGLPSLNEKLIRLEDLQPGDRVTLRHDAKAKSIDAYRKYDDRGKITEIDLDSGQVIVRSESGSAGTQTYAVGAETEILLGQSPVGLTDLRTGDVLQITHDSPGESIPEIDEVVAIRPPDKSKWAILIANQTFGDKSVGALASPIANARNLKEQLVQRYAVPEEQAIIFEDVEQVRLEREVPGWISKVPRDAELYVYLSTRAFSVPGENVYLAASDSKLETIEQTGVRLDWLIEKLDECATSHKALFVDCTHPDSGSDPAQVSTNEMIDVLRSTRRGGFPKSVYILGSCQRTEPRDPLRPLSDPEIFARTLAEGFSGGADDVRDNHIEITELAEFVKSRIAGSIAGAASPVLILPDPSPPRISQSAKTAILNLLAQFGKRNIDQDKLYADAASATRLSGGQPEANLALGVVLLKATKIDPAFEIIEAIRLKHPEYRIAHRCVVWVHFHKVRYDEGLKTLTTLLNQLPKPDELEDGYDAQTLQLFEWAGRLRELASSADWARRVPSASDLATYDQIVAQFGETAMEYHGRGRQHVKSVMADFDRKATDDPDAARAFKKGRLQNYVERIADGDAVSAVKAWLDK